jgi:hypothetical protein
MKFFIIGLSFFLVACSPSLVDEEPDKALEYARSLINLKVKILILKEKIEKSKINEKNRVNYENSILPKLLSEYQHTLINNKNDYLENYKKYENKVAAISNLNEAKKLSVQSYYNLALADYNKVMTKENLRIIALNKSLKSVYDEQIQKESIKQNILIQKMKAREKEQLKESFFKNKKIYFYLKHLVTISTESPYDIKKRQDAMNALDVYSSDFIFVFKSYDRFPEKVRLKAKANYESIFRTCINDYINYTCKLYNDMEKREFLSIPKLYSKYEFRRMLAVNIVPKLVLEKPKFIVKPVLKYDKFISEPPKPVKPINPIKPTNLFGNQKSNISRLKNNLINVSEKFLILNDVAVNKGLDVDWDHVLQEMSETGYIDLSRKTFIDDALIIIMNKHNE